MYYFVYGIGLTMVLPLLFVVIVGAAAIVSHYIRNHKVLIFTQLACITWISALIQWSIGSMEYSGLVICWSFLGPLGALIFLSLKEAIGWMIMFVIIVFISAWFEPALLGQILTVSDPVKIMFYIMNIGVSLTVVFFAATWFVQTIKKEKLRSDMLANRIQALLGQHVSKEVAVELIDDNKDKANSRFYLSTVMFVDIRDFTSFADSRAPREVGNFQNAVFCEFIDIIKDNNGIVLQALGDGIMAVFGAPNENKTHPKNAVKAGFQILDRIKKLHDSGEIPFIKLGIGLHTGKVIAGEVGNELRKFYLLSGSNVIIASRIEQLNKKLESEFLVSQELINHLPDNYITSINRGEQKLKGISRLIEIHQLV
ncbi:MAG: hypothetical protein KJO29_14820 [Bacteroidia bacterium]|nr:hypothetical protein [Bacteroidia bacterium]